MRTRITNAMLRTAGELGYRQATVEAVCARAEVSKGDFLSLFAGPEDCFAAGYDSIAEPLLEWARALPSEGGCPTIQAALEQLAIAVASDPALAGAVLLEAHVVSRDCRSRHHRLFEQLALELERVCAGPDSPGGYPSATALCVLGALEWTFAEALREGAEEGLRVQVPRLAGFAATAFAAARERVPAVAAAGRSA